MPTCAVNRKVSSQPTSRSGKSFGGARQRDHVVMKEKWTVCTAVSLQEILDSSSDKKSDDDMMVLHGLAAAVRFPRLSIFPPVSLVDTK